ncbi:MAG: hypothetical protein E4H23_07930 [Chrysiogenales bacterium]|nr:MAG: hypothetical protein E4H23_07930 [Chrysiogenales bacterium]
MNYFINNLFRDKLLWVGIGLGVVAALNLVDFLSFAFAAPGFFNMWVIKSTIGAAFAGAIVYALFLNRRDRRSRQLNDLLPVFQTDRRAYFEKMVAADIKFQTFCHECRHYDGQRRRCLLRLHERKVWIKLHFEDVFSYCLYWNLEDHPVLALTDRVKKTDGEPGGSVTSNK